MSAILFDIGGTHMRIAAYGSGTLGAVADAPTPQDPDTAIEEFARIARHVAPSACRAVGCVAGTVVGGVVSDARNLACFDGVDLAGGLAKRMRVPVTLVNDADAAVLGEAFSGAGKGKRRVAYIGLGTGVGTSLADAGVVVATASGGALRDQVMELPDGRWLEDLIGGRQLARTYDSPPRALPRSVWDTLTPHLCAAIERMRAAWVPDAIVIGGSLMDDEDGFRFADVVNALPAATRPLVVPAALGSLSGIHGAKVLAERIEKEG